MRYMLMVYGCVRNDEGSAERAAKVTAVNAFIEMCAEKGVLEAYDPLQEGHTATTVRVRDNEALVTDGPFAETREQLGGYFILNCRDLAEARAFAAACPMAAEGAVEVRPILAVPGLASEAAEPATASAAGGR
ncbi:MAG TPA: YciI family protein [Streptosporangiaceae bacterium]